jgi:hypothetical protein
MQDIEVIQHKIFEIRDVRVMFDFDLAALFSIENRVLKQSVRRNINRFPEDFMFILTKNELNQLFYSGVSQIVIPPEYNFGATMPMAFTEQGVAMLSGVLRSEKAIEVNISIMRAFVKMRQFIIQNNELFHSIAELKLKIEQLEQSGEDTLAAINDLSEDVRTEIDDIYIALSQLANKKDLTKRNPIGYIKSAEL